MADKSFGLKQVNLIGASGTPRIESPNNLNINATNVAISTDMSVGGQLSLGTGTSISSPGSNILTLGTNSAERVRITSDGKFGVGMTPSMFFEVLSNENDIARFSGPNSGNIVFRNDTSNEVQIHTGTSDALIFGTNGENERLRITSGGNVQIANGNLVFSTSGTGIDFSANANATGMSSELLDDYEEGTWTPSGSGNATHLIQVGNYTRIGRLVTVHFVIQINAIGTGSATQIHGIPFTPATNINGAGSCEYFESSATNLVTLVPRAQSGLSYLQMRTLTAAASGMSNSNILQNNTRVDGTVTYVTT